MRFKDARTATLVGAALAAAWLTAAPALAETPVVNAAPSPVAPADPMQERLAALEAQVETLSAEIAALKAESAGQIKRVQVVEKTQTAAPQVTIAGGRPQVTSADGKFSAAIRGAVQFDAAHYDVSPLRTDNDLASGTNFRRARLGVEGKAFGDWSYALWGEFGGTGGESPVLNQAFVEYDGLKPFGPINPLRLRIGAWATPAGLEDATTYTESTFLERPAVAELVRNFAGGDGRSGVGGFANGGHWYVSAVFTGAVVGVPATPEFSEQTGYLARVALNPVHGADYDLHLGANLSGALSPADTAAGPAVAHAVRLRERPELRVDGTRLVDTGNIAADGLTAYGLEGGLSFRNLYAAGEWFKIDVSRTAVGAKPSPFDPSFSGWYVQGVWTVTGERRAWSSASGGFRGIRPAKAFDPAKGTWGAWEIAGRYSVLDLDDQAGSAGSATPFGGIRGGRQRITTLGLNWYPNSVVRFLLDYQWTRVNRLDASGAQVGEDVDAASLRAQVAF